MTAAGPSTVTGLAAPAAGPARSLSAAELAAVRADFPLLGRTVRGDRPLVYLDTAATSSADATAGVSTAVIRPRPRRGSW